MKNTKTQIVAILNISPESFSGDGLRDRAEILERVKTMVAEGANIIDIGAQSTRPASVQLSLVEELARTTGLVREIKTLSPDIQVSIDTTRYEVAELAVSEGATIINDISGGRFDERVLKLLVDTPQILFVLTHSRGDFGTMHGPYHYQDIVVELKQYFAERVGELLVAGVRKKQIILDPGIGFSKGFKENLEIIKRFGEFKELGFPLYVGLSRKKFVGKIVDKENPQDRDVASALLQLTCIQKGANYIRTHNVEYVRQSIRVYQALAN